MDVSTFRSIITFKEEDMDGMAQMEGASPGGHEEIGMSPE